jgi:hypothetical protein
MEYEEFDTIQRGTGRGGGRAQTGSLMRPGRGRSLTYSRRTLEKLE